ncbi:hypothetical protein NMY22_g15974 [Coprinellus aureogranulatus]|nr:hypothetical protein NMY22_g15974 [Coprinellus aureogranulatus]
MRLPLELIESLIDHLSDDAASLKACALTSPILLATSQRRLFNTVVVAPPNTKPSPESSGRCTSPTTKLRELLLESPHLRQYIQHLRLENVGDVTADANGRSTHWLAQDSAFALLLPLLPAVKTLIWNSGVCGVNWYTLSPNTRQVLRRAFERWPLERFEVTAMFNLPLPLIKKMKGLRHLSLNQVHFVGRELPQNVPSGAVPMFGSSASEEVTPPLRLKTLTIVDPSRHLLSDLTRWVLDNVELSNLEGLHWNTYGSYFPKGNDMMEFLRVLEPAAESIRALSVAPALDGHGISTTAISSLSLPSLSYPRLKTLTFGFELTPFDASSSQWFKASLHNLAASPSIAGLERIQLLCHIAQGNPLETFDLSVWALQDTLIHPETGETSADRLKEVGVHLHAVYSEAKVEMQQLERMIVDAMDPLARRGVRVSTSSA